MNTSLIIRLALPLGLSAILIVTTLYAFRHVFLVTDTYLSTHGDWDYLWDDAKNFYNNIHMKRPAFTLANIRWAWSSDGQILGVWEPVSLMVKMIIHDVLDFSAARVDGGGGRDGATMTTAISGPRLYRMLSACWHTFNVVLAFWVGLLFVRSVNDYDYIAQQLHEVKEGKVKTNGGGKSKTSDSQLIQRGKKDRKNQTMNEQGANKRMDAEAARRALSYLHRHDGITTISLFLGTLTFFAVHPLQAQTIGWISCLSYILSCTFSLTSFWGYVAHRDIMRRWRRHLQAGGRPSEVRGPYMFGRITNTQNIVGKKKRSTGRPVSQILSEDRSEVMYWTLPKLISLFCYICATFCKSPAVTLPLVFIIVDVFIYSYPLSSRPMTIEPDANGTGKKIAGVSEVDKQSHGITMLLPNRVLGEFSRVAFPKLWNLTCRAIMSWLPFLLASFAVTVFVVKGNTKHLLDVQTPFEKVQKSAWALCWYATKIVWPSHLVAAVEKMSFSFVDHWEVAVALIAVPYATLVTLAYSTSNASGRIAACWYGCFVVILLPSLGLIQHGRLFLAADRYAYLPLLIFGPLVAALSGSLYAQSNSFVLPCGFGVDGSIPSKIAVDSGSPVRRDLSALIKGALYIANPSATARRSARMLLVLSCVGMIGASGWFAYNVTPETLLPWRNSMLLWAKNAKIFPETENAHVNLSAAYVNSGNPSTEDLEKGLYHAKEALEMRPDSSKYKANLGILYARLAKYDVGIPFLQKSLQEHPLTRWSPLMHKILAQCLDRKGRFEEAKQHYDSAIQLGEKSAQAELQRMMGRIKKSDAERAKKLESNKEKPKFQVLGGNGQNIKVDLGSDMTLKR